MRDTRYERRTWDRISPRIKNTTTAVTTTTTTTTKPYLSPCQVVRKPFYYCLYITDITAYLARLCGSGSAREEPTGSKSLEELVLRRWKTGSQALEALQQRVRGQGMQ